jgi:hypothetical protein
VKTLEVFIIQDGIETKVTSNSISIKKKEFSFKFIFHKDPNMRINISDNDNIYKAASGNIDQVYLFPFFMGQSFAEGLFNEDKDMIISENGNHYWYVEDKDDNRFDSVIVKDDKFTCIRTIKNIYDTPSKKLIGISKIKPPALYITIIRNSGNLTDKIVNFNTILNDKKSRHYDFVKWAYDNEYIDTIIYENEFAEEIERICFKINFK